MYRIKGKVLPGQQGPACWSPDPVGFIPDPSSAHCGSCTLDSGRSLNLSVGPLSPRGPHSGWPHGSPNPGRLPPCSERTCCNFPVPCPCRRAYSHTRAACGWPRSSGTLPGTGTPRSTNAGCGDQTSHSSFTENRETL